MRAADADERFALPRLGSSRACPCRGETSGRLERARPPTLQPSWKWRKAPDLRARN